VIIKSKDKLIFEKAKKIYVSLKSINISCKLRIYYLNLPFSDNLIKIYFHSHGEIKRGRI